MEELEAEDKAAQVAEAEAAAVLGGIFMISVVFGYKPAAAAAGVFEYSGKGIAELALSLMAAAAAAALAWMAAALVGVGGILREWAGRMAAAAGLMAFTITSIPTNITKDAAKALAAQSALSGAQDAPSPRQIQETSYDHVHST